jgi:hypothetical protein
MVAMFAVSWCGNCYGYAAICGQSGLVLNSRSEEGKEARK